MNIEEIPTPETDALVPTQGHKQTMLEYIETLEDHARDIERRLTVARDALTAIADQSENIEHAVCTADKALTQTAPKQ